ncbi:predicted protein [Phaeodactylum tricornutum CCAP 1055/1]|uniref:Mitochondrial splicing suppressor 51-like C-terminal domain-containing protein n=1 Tax=Phaeodactylum tricornutum (strain CCAP 1055/1) TaxID=556484 RepID=B7FTB7_PHATC|nr:predicted protein [Phaeodactylum tricornutum CCAP 1055/1]EEC50940.1 predicted protein [Phaeodactylum tricornutum CCAP 1055/1]|eukprot:XP_002178126.1 predicted protein [Phaeodactylum tricornutum CCAP 1055/1]
MTLFPVVFIPENENEGLLQANFSKYAYADKVARLLSVATSDDFQTSLLLRPSTKVPGLYAAHACTINNAQPNVRATRLSMACGLFRLRFYGNVVLWRTDFSTLSLSDVLTTCCVTPDLRKCVRQVLVVDHASPVPDVPMWLANAAKENYHDGAVLEKLAAAMIEEKPADEHSRGNSCDNSTVSETIRDQEDSENELLNATDSIEKLQDVPSLQTVTRHFVTNEPLCIHCRGPASVLCSDCRGVYFCTAPRSCRVLGWSHDCQCKTWELYISRRTGLSTFHLGPWSQILTSRPFQTSSTPYEKFLRELGVEETSQSWWRTEWDGWEGGTGRSARTVDVTTRETYISGLAPVTDIPPERAVTVDDTIRLTLLDRNEVGMLKLTSWREYYQLRDVRESSPIGLLLSFPLTLYYAIVMHGSVPCTVAHMLNRPLRIHVVGVEKELNFLDLFKEVSFLLPDDVAVELVFVVRKDMLPPSLSHMNNSFEIRLTNTLLLVLTMGTYGDSLDPNFDCGSGPPDMIMAFNAGLFAYESWRSVVTFLNLHPSVVGVFTDYNEYSGLHCASLGGASARESLRVNPFRQPRAMPVYSMNLPQMSNGFLYVFNEQKLE